MNVALEAGAEDLKREGDNFEITCDVTAFNAVQAALEAGRHQAGVGRDRAGPEGAGRTWTWRRARRSAKLLDALDDHDDVQNVYCNANLTQEMWEYE